MDPATTRPPADASAETGLCAICQGPVAGQPARTCPACGVAVHDDCWEYNGGCGMYGCSAAPPTEKLDPLEMPVSYWGRETKNCPSCGQEIQAVALRCRHCGALFETAQPQDASSYRARSQLQRDLPAVRRGTVWLLVLSIVPCTALPTAIFGGAWYAGHRRQIAELPSLYGALAKLALAIAIGQSALGILAALLHASLQ